MLSLTQNFLPFYELVFLLINIFLPRSVNYIMHSDICKTEVEPITSTPVIHCELHYKPRLQMVFFCFETAWLVHVGIEPQTLCTLSPAAQQWILVNVLRVFPHCQSLFTLCCIHLSCVTKLNWCNVCLKVSVCQCFPLRDNERQQDWLLRWQLQILHVRINKWNADDWGKNCNATANPGKLPNLIRPSKTLMQLSYILFAQQYTCNGGFTPRDSNWFLRRCSNISNKTNKRSW